MKNALSGIRGRVVRLTAVLFIGWTAFWGWTYFDAVQNHRRAVETTDMLFDTRLSRFAREPDDEGGKAHYRFLTHEAEAAMAWRDKEAAREQSASRIWARGVVGYFIAFGAAIWVWAGFRPAKTDPPTLASQLGTRDDDDVLNRGTGNSPVNPQILGATSFKAAPLLATAERMSQLRKRLYWGVFIATGADQAVRKFLTNGASLGLNLIFFVALGLLIYHAARITKLDWPWETVFAVLAIGLILLFSLRFV